MVTMAAVPAAIARLVVPAGEQPELARIRKTAEHLQPDEAGGRVHEPGTIEERRFNAVLEAVRHLEPTDDHELLSRHAAATRTLSLALHAEFIAAISCATSQDEQAVGEERSAMARRQAARSPRAARSQGGYRARRATPPHPGFERGR
jgi:hypothetical protein